MVLLQLLFTYAPFMNVALHTAPISSGVWGRVLAVAAAVFTLVEVETWWTNRARPGSGVDPAHSLATTGRNQ